MRHIDQLIDRLCPQGVRSMPLHDVIQYEQPGKYLVLSTNYHDEYKTPVLTAGQTFVLGYTDEELGVYPASGSHPVVIFDDFTTAFKWVDFPFKAKSSAMKMLTAKRPHIAGLRYLFYAMQTIQYNPQSHARQWIGTYSQFRVPVPPPEVQREIVRILDTFTKLEAELEAELEARRRQYAHYRLSILKSTHADPVTLRALGHWRGGVTPSKAEPRYWVGGTIPWLASMDVSDQGGAIRGRVTDAALSETALRLIPVPSVAVVMRSNILRRRLPIGLTTVPTTVNQDIRALEPRGEVDAEYVYQALRAASEEIRTSCVRTDGSMAAVDSKTFFDFRIPLPPLQEQRRVAEKLRSFDALVNDLNIGLPGELAARRKQYEHYRDRLLTFEEAAT